jgi:hypothetical protein
VQGDVTSTNNNPDPQTPQASESVAKALLALHVVHTPASVQTSQLSKQDPHTVDTVLKNSPVPHDTQAADSKAKLASQIEQVEASEHVAQSDEQSPHTLEVV